MVAKDLRPALEEYQSARSENRLLCLDFCQLNEYLFLLRDISLYLGQKMGADAMWYLAAAVSDFHVPPDKLVRFMLSMGIDGNFHAFLCWNGYDVGDAQDSIVWRLLDASNGKSAKGAETSRTSMVVSWIYRLF